MRDEGRTGNFLACPSSLIPHPSFLSMVSLRKGGERGQYGPVVMSAPIVPILTGVYGRPPPTVRRDSGKKDSRRTLRRGFLSVMSYPAPVAAAVAAGRGSLWLRDGP